MKLILAGSNSPLSSGLFHHCLQSSHTIAAVAVHRQSTPQRIITSGGDDIAMLARQHGIPVIELADADQAERDLRACDADVMAVACYPHRIAPGIAGCARDGAFNLHPSLLPRYRGPEPLFWQWKYRAQTGVSWHHLSPQLDAGDIARQRVVNLPTGCDYMQANRLLAEQGAALLFELCDELDAGRLCLQQQDETQASYYPYPKPVDFVIDTGQSAEAVFNFMRGTAVFGQPYRCVLSDGELWLQQALAFEPDAVLQTQSVAEGERIKLQCKPGVLIARQLAGKLAPTDTL